MKESTPLGLSRLWEEISQIRRACEASEGNPPESAFSRAMATFRWYCGSFTDAMEMFGKVAALAQLCRDTISDSYEKAQVEWLHDYCRAVSEGRYSAGEFSEDSSHFEMVALSAAAALKSAVPDAEKELVEEFQAFLMNIEGAYHDAYYVLRCVGNRHLRELSETIGELPPFVQDFILHGLDAFVGDRAVIQFYRDYIARTQHPWLKEQADRYLDTVAENQS